MAGKRKVTLKTSWMDEPDPFKAPGTARSTGDQMRCPSCNVPLKTSVEGTFFCWFCERKYDLKELRAAQAAREAKGPAPTTVGPETGPADDEGTEVELDFEMDMEEDNDLDDGASSETSSDADGDGAVDEDVIDSPDQEDEDLEFELEDDGTEVAAYEGDDVKEGAGAPSGPDRHDGETEPADDEEMAEVVDLDTMEDGEEEEWEADEDTSEEEWTDEAEVEEGSGPEDDDGDDEELDFEMELGPDDGAEEDAVKDDTQAAREMKDPAHERRIRKRFVDQSEVEFDP